MVPTCPADGYSIQFSQNSGPDVDQGYLWTEAAELRQYEALCRVVKRRAWYDRESGLWGKHVSLAIFKARRNEFVNRASFPDRRRVLPDCDLFGARRQHVVEIVRFAGRLGPDAPPTGNLIEPDHRY